MTPMLGSTVAQVVDALLATDAWKATKFLSDKSIVRATRKMYGKDTPRGRRIDKRDRSVDISLVIGKPNYLEREFIKKCRKAGEPIPVKRVQLKYPPKRRG